MKHLYFTLVLFYCVGISGSAFSQERKYLYGGMEIEGFQYTEPFIKILDDFNNYHLTNDLTTTHSFAWPDYILGYSVGYKIHVGFSEFGGNVHFTQFSTLAQGVSDTGDDYFNKLIVSHNGFHLFYKIMFINTNYFRTGPGIGFKVEQLKTKLNWDKNPSINTIIPANKALLSGQINYNFSIGGPKFNFDLGVFYQIPFWKINLNLLNSILNEAYNTEYPTNEMLFNPVSYGVNFTIGLGAKKNYDF